MACVTVMCRPCAPLTDDMSSSIRVPPLFNRYVCVFQQQWPREREPARNTKKENEKVDECVCAQLTYELTEERKE